MTNAWSEKAARIMNHYGAEKQLTLLCEECAELIQAACKCRRRGIAMHDDMIEEMADVAIMLMQFEMTMNRHELDSLDRIIGEKLDRQIGRINDDDYGVFQASEEERLKMFKNCCTPCDPFGSLSSFADIFISLMLVKRIEQLENELKKSGIEIPEWYDIFPQGIEKEDRE